MKVQGLYYLVKIFWLFANIGLEVGGEVDVRRSMDVEPEI